MEELKSSAPSHMLGHQRAASDWQIVFLIIYFFFKFILQILTGHLLVMEALIVLERAK